MFGSARPKSWSVSTVFALLLEPLDQRPGRIVRLTRPGSNDEVASLTFRRNRHQKKPKAFSL
jgi:hypothetical protein